MRVVRLILLGLLVYVISIVFLFPAAPLIERIQPNLQPLQLTGVSGKLFNGSVASVTNNDDLLPLQFNDVNWKLAPATIVKGGIGADVNFKGYGGGGEAQVRQQLTGETVVSNFIFTAQAAAFEELLPAPVASFTGTISGDVSTLKLKNQLLTEMAGALNWSDAVINTSFIGVPVKLGNIDINIEKVDENTHKALLSSTDGDLTLDGSIDVSLDGNYKADVLITPKANAPQALVQQLGRFARPDAGGRYRWQQNGNVNQGF